MSRISPVRIPQAVPCPDAIDLHPNYRPCAKTDRRAVLTITILGSSLAFMDGSIVNVALPTLQDAFRAGLPSVQWVVQSYALFCAALLLFAGALGDRFGRKKIFVLGVTLFTVASLGCALANSLSMLVASRSFQGIGAALLIPQSLAILSAAYSSEDRAAAIGSWSAWTSVFAAIGPILGGWLIQAFNWRWVFAINLPVAAWILLLVPKLRESPSELSWRALRRLDLKGTLWNTLGLGALVYALSFAPEYGWKSLKTSGSLATGVILIVMFLMGQARRKNALMPLNLFANPRFLSVNILTFLLYGALAVTFYMVPFFAIQVRHLSATLTGAAFLPCIAVMFVFSGWIGRLSNRLGEKPFLIAGAVTSSIGTALFAICAGRLTYLSSFLPGMIVLGVGITTALAPLTNVVMTSVPADKSSLASAVNNAVSRLAGLVVLSVLLLVGSHSFNRALARKMGGSLLSPQARQELSDQRSLMAAAELPQTFPPDERRMAKAIVADAYLEGYEAVMYCCAWAALLSAVPIFIWWGEAPGKKPVTMMRSQLLRKERQQLA